MYNEEAGIEKFLNNELMPVLEKMPEKFEIIIVDDGSIDGTIEKIIKFQKRQKQSVRIVAFVRNFGKEEALTAGIREAKGDAIIMIDADGQHPTTEIPKMVTKWQQGAKIVTAVRGHNTTKHRIASKLYYMMIKMIGNKNVVAGAMDFRLIDRVVADEFNKFTEHNRITRGLIDWLGFPQEYIKVKIKNRTDGCPSYNYKKLMALAGDSLASMSRTPLVIFGYIGMFITVFSLLFGLFILIQQYILGDPMGLDWSGAVAVSVFVAFLVGLVLVSQSLIALYISQIHTEAKKRPLYVIDREKSIGLNNEK